MAADRTLFVSRTGVFHEVFTPALTTLVKLVMRTVHVTYPT